MNPYFTHLQCSSCSATYPKDILINLCDCGKPLLVKYTFSDSKKENIPKQFDDSSSSMWRYGQILPINNIDKIVSLGEGNTPLIKSRNISNLLGLDRVWIKDEGSNPTGSFKARGLSLAVTMARVLGAQKLAIPSAGNAGGDLAAYAARAGLEANIFLPRDVPPANRIECQKLGARVTLVNGLINDCGRLIAEKSKKEKWFDLSTLKEPYRIEGKKTLGLELAEQLGWRLPDVIIYPTGGGTGLIGMWKGFLEMQNLGWIGSKLPRMVSVQAEGCAPIVDAFNRNLSQGVLWPNARTCASGLRVPQAIGDFIILKILKSSNGTAVSVSDDEIMKDTQTIMQLEGLFVCPEGGATLSALKKLIRSNFIKSDDEVVLFNTGSGLKYLHLFESN